MMDQFKVTYLYLQYTVRVFITFNDKGMWFKKKRTHSPTHLKVWGEIKITWVFNLIERTNKM